MVAERDRRQRRPAERSRVTTGSDIVCVITNTRETGKLEVQKDLSPTTDGGLFNLQIDGTTDGDATDVGDGGSTGEETLNTGDHTVGETAGTDTDLADYQKSIECKADNGAGAVVAGTTGDDAGPLTVPVTTGSDIVCVITNTRETGKLEVQKDLSPSDGRRACSTSRSTARPTATRATSATAARRARRPSTPATTPSARPPGPTPTWPTTRSRSSAGPTTAPAPWSPSTTGDDAGPLTVSVTTGSDIVCVITNTRETGKLEVQKDLSPSDRRRASSTSRSTAPPDPTPTDVGDGGSTGEETLNTGSHTVGETAGTDTDLADYQKSIECRADNGTGAVVAKHHRRQRRSADRAGHDRAPTSSA